MRAARSPLAANRTLPVRESGKVSSAPTHYMLCTSVAQEDSREVKEKTNRRFKISQTSKKKKKVTPSPSLFPCMMMVQLMAQAAETSSPPRNRV